MPLPKRGKKSVEQQKKDLTKACFVSAEPGFRVYLFGA
jgi:hypothetical protein